MVCNLFLKLSSGTALLVTRASHGIRKRDHGSRKAGPADRQACIEISPHSHYLLSRKQTNKRGTAVRSPETAGARDEGPSRSAAGSRNQRRHCICGKCPTYTECMRESGDLLFCINGKSPACMFEKKECLCPSCTVCGERRLTGEYFCIRN